MAQTSPPPRWEYLWVAFLDVTNLAQLNTLGASGWRVVPNTLTSSGWCLMERQL